jgi:hypothetical protein
MDCGKVQQSSERLNLDGGTTSFQSFLQEGELRAT